MTHTYAILEVSASTAAEIRKLLTDAGYQHAFHDDVIDMHGIALKARAVETAPPTDLSKLRALCEETRPGLYTYRASAEDELRNMMSPEMVLALLDQLAAVTAARDELADLADSYVFAPTNISTAAGRGPYQFAATAPPNISVFSGVVTIDTGKPYRDKARIQELRKAGR